MQFTLFCNCVISCCLIHFSSFSFTFFWNLFLKILKTDFLVLILVMFSNLFSSFCNLFFFISVQFFFLMSLIVCNPVLFVGCSAHRLSGEEAGQTPSRNKKKKTRVEADEHSCGSQRLSRSMDQTWRYSYVCSQCVDDMAQLRGELSRLKSTARAQDPFDAINNHVSVSKTVV